MSTPKTPPDKTEIAKLESFAGLEMEQIFVVTDTRQAELAREELMAAKIIGFDTESKPTFHKGQKSKGPHVLQFATTEKAFIFQAHVEESHAVVIDMLRSAELTKIGFDLKGDLHQISGRFGIRPESIVDLDRHFKKLGYRNSVGAKSAIAMLFNRRFVKSKSITTSNWELQRLSERQLVYAANDAYAAVLVYHALQQGAFPGNDS